MGTITIGDVKISALKLMFANYNDKITAIDGDDCDNIANLEYDAEYGKYLVNMNECINRANMRLSAVGALPIKSYSMNISKGNRAERINLKEKITDFYCLIKIIIETEDEYIPDYPFDTESDGVIRIPAPAEDCTLIVLYAPKENIITDATPNTAIFENIPDELAILIPYFIKSELFEEEQPELATQARNIFESSVADRISSVYSRQKTVQDVYGGCE